MPTLTRGDQPRGFTHRPSENPPPPSPPAAATFTACFFVVAGADPATMPRLANVFAKRGLTPTAWHGTMADGGTLHVDIQLAAATRDLSQRLAQDLRRLVLVETVLTSPKQVAAEA